MIKSLLLVAVALAGGWQLTNALSTSTVATEEQASDNPAAQSAVPLDENGLPEPPPTLSPEAIQSQTTVTIVRQLQNHYRQLQLDDALADQVFERYLSDLDPNHLYFLANDIESFQPLRKKMATELRNGNLSAGFAIFNQYQQRARQRLEYQLSMLDDGLDKLDFDTDDEILLDRSEASWAADEDELNQVWEHRLKNAVLAMRLDGLEDEEIVTRLDRRYRSQINRLSRNTSEDAFQFYINALGRTFDPHTNWFTPHRSENFNISMSRSLEGIGAVLQMNEEYTRVVRLVPGGPADQGGALQPADRIIAVGQEDEEMINVIGWRLDEVVDMIRGPKDSKVRLEVIPAGSASEHTTREITIVRNKVVLEDQAAQKEVMDVSTDIGDIRIGVIDIPAFYLDFEAYRRGDQDYTSTTRDVYKLIKELEEENVQGLIIDLRNNGGGSLHEATQLVSLFINRGPTVQVRDNRGRVKVEQDNRPGVLYGGPMAVLVNRFSASASEIFAGAMQDYGRALIVGDHTYGKGTVQTLLPLNHGQLKMTTNKFYRVSGSSNQNRGIVPDIILPNLVNTEDIGEGALPNAMPWDEIDPAKYNSVFDLSPYIESLERKHARRIKEDSEFIYILEQQELLSERRERKTLTLNEEQRREQEQDWESRRLVVENARREARGDDPVESISELNKILEQRALDPDNEEDKGPDAWLDETGAILGDLISMIYKERLAAKKND